MLLLVVVSVATLVRRARHMIVKGATVEEGATCDSRPASFASQQTRSLDFSLDCSYTTHPPSENSSVGLFLHSRPPSFASTSPNPPSFHQAPPRHTMASLNSPTLAPTAPALLPSATLRYGSDVEAHHGSDYESDKASAKFDDEGEINQPMICDCIADRNLDVMPAGSHHATEGSVTDDQRKVTELEKQREGLVATAAELDYRVRELEADLEKATLSNDEMGSFIQHTAETQGLLANPTLAADMRNTIQEQLALQDQQFAAIHELSGEVGRFRGINAQQGEQIMRLSGEVRRTRAEADRLRRERDEYQTRCAFLHYLHGLSLEEGDALAQIPVHTGNAASTEDDADRTDTDSDSG